MEVLFDILRRQEFLIYFIGVMIAGGIIKEYKLFGDLYGFLASVIPNKKLNLLLTSAISGGLPVEGRVVLSAPILDSITNDTKNSRAKFGLVDYLSTHHFYWWSPLEKTVLLPMIVFKWSYAFYLSQIWPFLAISIGMAAWYIFTQVENKDLTHIPDAPKYNGKRLLISILPFAYVTAGLLIAQPEIPKVFLFVPMALYYILLTKAKRWWKHIKWKNVAFLSGILALASLTNIWHDAMVEHLAMLGNPWIGAAAGFGFAYLLGSSAKYAGFMVLLSQLFGLQYFQLFAAFDYCGYLLSPAHKCLALGKMIFGTPIREYYKVIAIWASLIMGYSVLHTIF